MVADDPRADLGRPEKLKEACRIVRRAVAELQRFCTKHEIHLALVHGKELASGKVNDIEAYGDGADHG